MGAACSPIAGATDRTYTATLDDFGTKLRVTVTATAPGGETDTADSTSGGSISGQVFAGTAAPGNRLAPGASVRIQWPRLPHDSHGRRWPARVGCPAASAATCMVSVTVTAKARKKNKPALELGASTFAVATGATATLLGQLSPKGTKLLRKAKQLKQASLAVTALVPGGAPNMGTVGATLVAKRR